MVDVAADGGFAEVGSGDADVGSECWNWGNRTAAVEDDPGDVVLFADEAGGIPCHHCVRYGVLSLHREHGCGEEV